MFHLASNFLQLEPLRLLFRIVNILSSFTTFTFSTFPSGSRAVTARFCLRIDLLSTIIHSSDSADICISLVPTRWSKLRSPLSLGRFRYGNTKRASGWHRSKFNLDLFYLGNLYFSLWCTYIHTHWTRTRTQFMQWRKYPMTSGSLTNTARSWMNGWIDG